jgi:hypothetical protein
MKIPRWIIKLAVGSFVTYQVWLGSQIFGIRQDLVALKTALGQSDRATSELPRLANNAKSGD